MSAYLITNYRVTNPDGYSKYTAAVMPTIIPHGGEVLVAGAGSIAIEGNPDPVTVVVRFASMEALKGWYNSPEYQAIIHHRTDNSEGSMVFAEQFSVPPS